MLDVWSVTVEMDKNNVSLPQTACAAANLLWSHCAAIWIEWETNGKRKEKKKKGCCYILSSGQRPCWEPSRRGMYSIDPWWDETVTLLHGENKFWIFLFSVFFSIFFPFFLKPLKFPTVFIMCVASFSVSVDDALEIFFFFWLWMSKKSCEERREKSSGIPKTVKFLIVWAGNILCADAQCPVDHAAHTGAIWRLRPWSCRLIWFPW